MSQENLTPEQIAAAEAKAKAEAEAEAKAKAEADAKAAKTAVEARVLVECQYGLVGAVVKVPKADVKAAEDAGLIDSNKDAVAYAKSVSKV